MTSTAGNLFTRPDTFFGVCQGLGDDLGIHPNLLRVALAGLMFWSPYYAIGAYSVAGLLVLVSRLIAPEPATAAATVISSASPEIGIAHGDAAAAEAETHADPLPLAA